MWKCVAKIALLGALLSLPTGCWQRQYQADFDGTDYRPVLLLPQQALQPEQIERLFQSTQSLRQLMPDMLRGWTQGQGEMLPLLQSELTCVLKQEPAALARALRPYQVLSDLPLDYQQVVVPLDADLSELTITANRELGLAYRVLGALQLAEQIRQVLPQQQIVSDAPRETPLASAQWGAQAVASVSWLNLLLQAEQAAQGLPGRLADLESALSLQKDVVQRRLRKEPGRLPLRGDLDLLGDLLESTRQARARLSFARPQLPAHLLLADAHLEKTGKQQRLRCQG